MFPFRITSEFKTSEHESRVSLLIEYSSSQQVALARSLKIQGTLYVDVIVKFGADRSIGYSRRGMGRGGRRGGRGTTSHRFLDACRLKKKKLALNGREMIFYYRRKSSNHEGRLHSFLFFFFFFFFRSSRRWKNENREIFFFISYLLSNFRTKNSFRRLSYPNDNRKAKLKQTTIRLS